MAVNEITSKKKYEYTVEDAWSFAMKMVFGDGDESKWFKQKDGSIFNYTYESVMNDYNEWRHIKDEFVVAKQVKNKDGRIGYIVKSYGKVVNVAYLDDGDISIKAAYVKDLELTGGYSDSVRQLVEDM